ncbi:MAG: hypothetical protein Q4C66_04930 [Lachnospiraceae bacterium]|nr:hypothetical protein [Lachnospiraceae bacterium]
MQKKGKFMVYIVSQENFSWQGQVTWLNEKKTKSFRSLLELIKMMDSAIETEES